MQRSQDMLIGVDEHREDKEMIESMLTNNKMHLLYDAVDETGVGEEMEEEEDQEQIKTVYTLFEYLKKPFLDGMRLDYNEVYETFIQRASLLIDEIEEDKPIIEEIIDTFLSRMVLNLITQDKVAFKVQDDMVHCLEELYDHHEKPLVIDRSSGSTKENKKKKNEKEPVLLVKNDFAHYDQRNSEIAQRAVDQCNSETDAIEAHCSKAKKRGRHQKIRNEFVINTVEALAGNFIEKRQTLLHPQKNATTATASPPTSPNSNTKTNGIDYYPIFKETLNIFNRCIPKAKNHGFYLKRLIRFIRTLDSHVWPLHGLMALANNMNYCVHAETVKMSFDRNVRRFYCCYSAKEIQDGETVTCIRVVENDAIRLKEWRDNPPSNRKPFDTPEFTRSVGAFYLKKELYCPTTLFFTEFPDTYKSHFPDCFDTANKSTAAAAAAAAATEPIKRKNKRKVIGDKQPQSQSSSKKIKTESQILLSDIKCEDSRLFEPLRAKNPPSMLRIVMRHLYNTLETHLIQGKSVWYAQKAKEEYRRNYEGERLQIVSLLEKMTKKSFKVDMKQLGFYSVISSPSFANIKEDATQLDLADTCIEAMLDFIEALIVPERKFSVFAAVQKGRMMRALTHHTEERIKRRKGVNLFLFSSSSLQDAGSKMTQIHWLMCCPLLFIILFGQLAKDDVTGLLKEENVENYQCDSLFESLLLTLM